MKTIPEIQKAVADAIGADVLLITKSHPTKMVGVARHVAMDIARTNGYGLSEIAAGFELKSHATVIYAVHKAKEMEHDPVFSEIKATAIRILNGKR